MVLHEGYRGAICEIKNFETNRLLSVGYIKRVDNDYILIGERTDALNYMALNTKVKVSIFNAKFGFRVVGAVVYTSTQEELKLSEVREIVNGERRDYFRVDMSLEAKFYKYYGRPPGSANIFYDAQISNMSLKGILAQTDMVMEEGDYFWAEFRIGDKKCECNCRVIRRSEEGDEFVYGCEFVFMRPESAMNMDVISAFLFQQQQELLRQRRKSKY
ncbi:MAG: PilZ domain-containing protein [Oscillospiraceae bacterium]|jgi:hypothetical protein|nr:PilZ domain-containing protein [Oscillospiraceae bacterium]